MNIECHEPNEGYQSLAQRTRSIREKFSRTVEAFVSETQENSRPELSTAIADAAERFQLWAGSVGAAVDPQRRISLEWRLREAPEIKERIYELQSDLTEALDDLFAIAKGQRQSRTAVADSIILDPDSDTDQETTHFEIPAIEEAQDILGVILECVRGLLQLSILIRKATPRNRWNRALQKSSTDRLDDLFDIRHVGDKFPKLNRPEYDWLKTRIGRAITQRRQFIRYSRDHKTQMNRWEDEDQNQPYLPEFSQHLAIAGVDGMPVAPGLVDTMTLKPSLTEGSTKASTLQAVTLDAIQIDDNDDETSAVSSVVSSLDLIEGGEDRLQLPTLATVNQGHDEFECPICFTIQSFRHQRQWKRHAFADLKPYVCSAGKGECDLELFGNRNNWFSHELENHRHYWACFLCQKEFSSLAKFRQHVQNKHREIPAEQILDVTKLCKKPLELIPASDCPFCDDYDTKLREAQGAVEQDVVVIPARNFRRHVASHLEQLALFALGSQEPIKESDSRGSISSHGATFGISSHGVTVGSEKSKSQPGELFRNFFCTYCAELNVPKYFKARADWKRHEMRMHETGEDWPCPVIGCSRVFNRQRDFIKHHSRYHAGLPLPSVADVGILLLPRRVFGCGFERCKEVSIGWDERCDHVAKHMKNGATSESWQYSKVIQNLIRQEALYDTWKELLTNLDARLKECSSLISWAPDNTRTLRQKLQCCDLRPNREEVLITALSLRSDLPLDPSQVQLPQDFATPSRKSVPNFDSLPREERIRILIGDQNPSLSRAHLAALNTTLLKAFNARLDINRDAAALAENEGRPGGRASYTDSQASNSYLNPVNRDTDQQLSTTDAPLDQRTKILNRKNSAAELQSILQFSEGIEGIDLGLDDPRRHLICRSDLMCLTVTNTLTTGEGAHAILLDNYFILADFVTPQPGDKEVYIIRKPPIPIDLLVLEDTKPLASDLFATGMTSLNSFTIVHLGKITYILRPDTYESVREWWGSISTLKFDRAESLRTQHAEPFGLRVLANAAFGENRESKDPDPFPVSRLFGPLHHAIRTFESRYGNLHKSPINKVKVNCASSYNLRSQSMLAVGTDSGVYITKSGSTEIWLKAISVFKVNQLAILQAYSLVLILSDKTLLAYHLDSLTRDVATPGPVRVITERGSVGFFTTCRQNDRDLIIHCTFDGTGSLFTALEVLKPTGKKFTGKPGSRLSAVLSRNREPFRPYANFYVPSFCTGLNPFSSNMAILTRSGFEIINLDTKQPLAVPYWTESTETNPKMRHKVEKSTPLGMFGLYGGSPDPSKISEFLCVYETFAIYMGESGELSRPMKIMFSGQAQRATVRGSYLLLFHNDFVEIRTTYDGSLKQVISGKEIMCIDDGTANDGNVKMAMQHPNNSQLQLILEVALHEDEDGSEPVFTGHSTFET